VFRITDPVLALHEELIDFYEFMKDTPEEVSKKERIVTQLEEVAQSIWPDASVVKFGSFATGL
jgi:DNA polymerase sigma